MFHRFFLSALIVLCVVASAAAQGQPPAAAAPAQPRAVRTAESYEKRVAALISQNEDESLWDRTDPMSRLTLFERAQRAVVDVQKLQVGPALPRPFVPLVLNDPDKPVAVSKAQWQGLLKALQEGLQRAAKSKPGYELPPTEAFEVSWVLSLMGTATAPAIAE